MEVVVIQQSKNLPSLEPSMAGAEASCSLCEGSSSTEAVSVRDDPPSMLMALLLRPVHADIALEETQQMERVCRVVVVALVLTKNSFGFRATSSSADLGMERSKRDILRKIKTYAATANRTSRRLTVFIIVLIEPCPLWSTHTKSSPFIGGQHWVKRLQLMTCNSQQREQEKVS